MAFKLTPEQQELKNSLRRLLQDQATSEYLRKRIDSPEASDPKLWNKLVELGIFTYFSSKDEDFTPVFKDLVILAGESGRALLPESLINCLFSGVYLCTQLAGKDNLQETLKFDDKFWKELEDGSHLTCYLPTGSSDLEISGSENSLRANGTLRFVPSAAGCTYLVLSHQDALYFINIAKKALIEPENMLDGTLKHYSVCLKNAECIEFDGIQAAEFTSLYSILLAAEISGASAKLLDLTNKFVKEREQFGVPVGSFQAVQHKLADMYLSAEAMEALIDFAAWAADNSKDQLPLAAIAAINYARQVSIEIAEAAIQLHGGMGFTWEADLHLYLRRIRTVVALSTPAESSYKEILRLADN